MVLDRSSVEAWAGSPEYPCKAIKLLQIYGRDYFGSYTPTMHFLAPNYQKKSNEYLRQSGLLYSTVKKYYAHLKKTTRHSIVK